MRERVRMREIVCVSVKVRACNENQCLKLSLASHLSVITSPYLTATHRDWISQGPLKSRLIETPLSIEGKFADGCEKENRERTTSVPVEP